MDAVIKNARIPGNEKLINIYINNGRIAKLSENEDDWAAVKHDAAGKLVVPGFIDIHTHLEKVLTAHLMKNESGTLAEAVGLFNDFFAKVTAEEFYKRAKEVLEMAISNGTTAIRSHITIDKTIGLRAVRALLKLKREYAHLITLQVIAFPASSLYGIDGEIQALVEQAMEEGADLIGGCPNLSPDYRNCVDRLFEIAARLDVDIDLHVDEKDEPSSEVLDYVADKTVEYGYEGRVTCGHCCSLSAVNEEKAADTIHRVKKAGITIVTLPSCNLYLIGRGDRGLVRRGITRVEQLLAEGVNVCTSSDNVRDPFRPFGNADMLEEMLITAQITRMSSENELNRVFMMGTYNPAKAMRLKDYGILEGCCADLVVLDSASIKEALLGQCERTMIFKRGRLIAENSKTTVKHWNN